MDFKVVKADTQILQKKAFAIRKEVFVDEQKVAREDEFDSFENQSHHFVALNSKGRPLGACRWRETKQGIKLERFAVKKNARNKGIGSALVQATLEDIDRYMEKGTYLYMHAQRNVASWYEKFGFQKEGESFMECDILHYLMYKRI